MNPKISVIMGVFNCAQTIQESLESIINQTYVHWEIIICDDGSTDETYNLISRIVEKYPSKMVLIKNDMNRGLAYSLNHCLRYVTGDFIARQDGDDLSDKYRFQTQVDFLLENSEFDLVGTKMKAFDQQGIIGERGVNESIPNKYIFLKSTAFCHATIMSRKEVYEVLNGYRVHSSTLRTEDLDLWFRFFEKGFKGYNISQALYFVRDDRGAYKRRTIQNYFNIFKVSLRGYKKLKMPMRYYIFLLKPLVTICIPQSIIQKYHLYKVKMTVTNI